MKNLITVALLFVVLLTANFTHADDSTVSFRLASSNYLNGCVLLTLR